MSQSGTSRLELLVQALSARLELVEQDNRDLRARVSRLESEGYVLVCDGQERPATPPRAAGTHLPYPVQASTPERPQVAASSSTSAPSSVSSGAPSEPPAAGGGRDWSLPQALLGGEQPWEQRP